MPKPAEPPVLCWLRRDLRLRDNPALAAALKAGPAVAIYILDDRAGNPYPLGGAQGWWLHHSLTSLAADLDALGVPLVLRRGDPLAILPYVLREAGATILHCGRQYDGYGRALEDKLATALQNQKAELVTHNNALLQEPWELATKGGTPFKVYGPFSRALFAAAQAKPLAIPKAQSKPAVTLHSDRLVDWRLLPTRPNWATGFAVWQPGEAAAHKALQRFVRNAGQYGTGRNLPSEDFSSRLSPYLAFGELSPRQVWQAVTQGKALDASRTTYLKELAWREFAYHTLYYNPQLPATPLDTRYVKFPYRHDRKTLAAWQRGRTGYPIVDAGLRQLWQTGWMHNRVRLIAASFLVKHLLLPWQDGLDWFRDTLVDHDLANNAMNWQWIAGCGPDAAPYFRIFNPVLQSRKFKAEDYIRAYVPELAKLPDRYLHAPWLAPASAREKIGLVLDRDYPAPIVDYDAARQRALLAFQAMRAETAKPGAATSGPAKPRSPRAATKTAAPARRTGATAAGR